MLTPILRPAIDGPAPLALLDAPQAGTGKTLLAEVIALVTTGRAPIETPPQDEAEWGKRITALLMRGATVILIDELRETLRSGKLAAALTATTWEDRILGRSEMVQVPQRATWMATGNNLKIGGDLPRRCYWIRLDSQTSRPWQRTGFRHPDLKAWVTENRGPLVTALLTLARAWYAAGKPTPSKVVPLGGFEGWQRTVGGILAFAGVDAFLGNVEAMYEQADEGAGEWEDFLVAWDWAFGDRPVTVGEVCSRLNATGPLLAALPDDLEESLGQDGFSRKLGRALAKREAKRFGERQFRVQRAGMDTHNKRVRWQVRGMRGMRSSSHPKSKQSRDRKRDSKGAETDPPNTANPQNAEQRATG